MGRHTGRPWTSSRSVPLTFDCPLNLAQVTTFHLPSSIEIGASESTIDDAAFHYESHLAHDGKTITITHVLRATHDAVPTAGVAEHLTRLNEVSDHLGTKLSRSNDAFALASAANGAG